MRYRPHDYQRQAERYIVEHPVCALFLDMGLGKTVITLTAIDELMHDCFEVSHVLVIAPLRVARNTWPDEIGKWDHLKHLTCSVVLGTEHERLAALMRRADIYIINRENVEWLVTKSGVPFTFDMIVIDELSSFKSGRTKRFKALMRVRPRAARVVGLTGTPSANGLMDLWAEFRVLDMGKRLGRFIGSYREQYFVPDKRNQTTIFSYKPRPGAEEKIYERISDITISMSASDYLDMPELVRNIVKVKLSKKEQEKYEKLKADMVLELDGKEVDAANAAALCGKLLQMADGSVYDGEHHALEVHGRKLDALEDLIEGANGKPVLVAYWFQHDHDRIAARFPEAQDIRSTKDIHDWNEGKVSLGLIHPASAGHGLNLQAGGSTLVWFGLTWSLELYQQTNARLYRQGQSHAVVIHHIVAEGTIDESVLAALERKDKTQSALVSAVKAELGR